VQRTAVTVGEHIGEHGVRRVQEERQTERFNPIVKRLEPLVVDARIAAHAAGQIDAFKPRRPTASSSTASATPVSTSGTAALAQNRPG